MLKHNSGNTGAFNRHSEGGVSFSDTFQLPVSLNHRPAIIKNDCSCCTTTSAVSRSSGPTVPRMHHGAHCEYPT